MIQNSLKKIGFNPVIQDGFIWEQTKNGRTYTLYIEVNNIKKCEVSKGDYFQEYYEITLESLKNILEI